MSISGSLTTSSPSLTILAAPPVSRCAFGTSLSATRLMRISRPARRWISSRLRARMFQAPPPTVPIPSSPTLIGFIARRLAGSCHPARLEQPVLAEHLLDAAHRLAQAVLVFDQGDPDVIVAVVAEPDARRNGDLR